MATPAEFSQQYGPIAIDVGRRLKVDPSILLGQWGLETGWGKSVIPGTNNLGNIKDFSGGGTAAVDNMTGSNDRYRIFETPEAFADHFTSLIERKYPKAVGTGSDATAFASALKAGGYAEDPGYVDKIASVTNTVRKQPGVLDSIAAFVFPSAMAGELPSGKKPKAWKEVVGSERFKELSPEEQAEAQQEYFDSVVAPRVKPEEVEAVRNDFFTQYQTPAMKQPTPDPQKPLVTRFGEALMDVPRQLGLTARYGMEGLGQAATVLTEPIRQAVNPALRAVGLPEAMNTGGVMASAADAIGLPTPQNATERVVGDASRLMAGGAGITGAARSLANGATGVTQAVMSGLAANPGSQTLSAAGAGLAGGSVREAGGGPLAQGAAALAGGLVAPMAGAAASRAGAAVARNLPGTRPSGQMIEQQIELTLNQTGVDWAKVPQKVKNSMRQEVGNALKMGQQLDPASTRRLLDFKMVDGATPTRGTITLNPVDITREKNLAKIGANTGDRSLQGLAMIENQNNSSLIRALNNQGANTTDDAYGAGETIMSALQKIDVPRAEAVKKAYQAVRDADGRYATLNRSFFSNRANDLLDQQQLGPSLPQPAMTLLNNISENKIPFDVNTVTMIDKRLSGIARDAAGKGDNEAALAVRQLRNALNETPVESAAGEQALKLYKEAVSLAKKRFKLIETPAMEAALDPKTTPDKFVNTFITGGSGKAQVKSVTKLAEELKAVPEAYQSARGQIAAHLKEKALNGATDELGNFSASAYNKALRTIGERKLSAFFSKAEIEELKAVGRVSSYMQVQPRGSAVNNSNSGALSVGRSLDFLDTVASKVPLFGVGPTLQGVIRGVQQGSAQNIGSSLIQDSIPNVSFSQRLSNAAIPAGLLSGAPIPERE